MLASLVADFAIRVNMCWCMFSLRRPLLLATRKVKSTQEKLLLKILKKNTETEFGRKHNFGTIKSMDDFRKRVPIQTYDQLVPYVDNQINGEIALTVDMPQYYARTSGTTGRYKDIPLTENGLTQVRDAQKHLALSLWLGTDFLKGSVLGFASAAEEGKLQNGCRFGSVSGSVYKSLSPLIERKFVVPSAAFSISNVEAKYQIYALSVLASDNITGLVAANPSSIQKLILLIQENGKELLSILQGVPSDWLLPEAIDLLPGLRRTISQKRIKQLETAQTKHGLLLAVDVFSELSTVATWTGGSCGIALAHILPHLPKSIRVVEYGYGASEFMGSVNVDAIENLCLPQLTQHVYEFVLRDDWDANRQIFVAPHELIPGQDYYVFVTTQSGLYRYNINDVVRAGKKVNECATIAFLQKGRGVTNITGEKLSEHQLIQVLGEVLENYTPKVGGYLALANEVASRYDIYIESVATDSLEQLAIEIDQGLCEANAEYDDKRRSDRLHPLEVIPLAAGACEQIKRACVAEGVREAQYKPTVLAYTRDWSDKIAGLKVQ